MTYIERIAIAIQHQQMGTWDGDDQDAIEMYLQAKKAGVWLKDDEIALGEKLSDLGVWHY